MVKNICNDLFDVEYQTFNFNIERVNSENKRANVMSSIVNAFAKSSKLCCR